MQCATNRGETVPNDPAATIGRYLTSLAEDHSLFNPEVRDAELRRRAQVEQHVIKDEDIPSGYYEMQQRIAREQGFGDVELDETIVRRMNFVVQADQRTSLKRWADYLSGASGEEAPFPEWFKYYTYRSVTQLTNYDREKGLFRKRSKGTTAIFPELNVEALSFVHSTLEARLNNEDIEDRTTADLAAGANFAKLYAHAIEKVQSALSPELMKEVEGSWVTYSKSVDPEVGKSLAESLEGKGTGWCIAGESTARGYLAQGDFHTYYTKDKDGESTIPRLAIRMSGNAIAEVRGIVGGTHAGLNQNQDVEPILSGILTEKLQDLPGGEAYFTKLQNMREVTRLEKIIRENPGAMLTIDELRFLYEVNGTIKGFGNRRDPRIQELRDLRPDTTEDIAKAYNYAYDPGTMDGPEALGLIIAGQGRQVLDNLMTYHGLDAEIAQRLIHTFLEHIRESKEYARSLSDKWFEVIGEGPEAFEGAYALHMIRVNRASFLPSMQLGEDTWRNLAESCSWSDEYEKLFDYLDLFDAHTRELAMSTTHQAEIYNGTLLEHLDTPDALLGYKHLNADTARWILGQFKEEGWQEDIKNHLDSFDEDAKKYISEYFESDEYIAIANNDNIQVVIHDCEEVVELFEAIATKKLLNSETAQLLCTVLSKSSEELVYQLTNAKKSFDNEGQKVISKYIHFVESELTESASGVDWSELDEGYQPLNS